MHDLYVLQGVKCSLRNRLNPVVVQGQQGQTRQSGKGILLYRGNVVRVEEQSLEIFETLKHARSNFGETILKENKFIQVMESLESTIVNGCDLILTEV